MTLYLHISSVSLAFSIHVLLVMSIERCLGAYYPIFHRTSVTRRRLMILLAILLIFPITLQVTTTHDMIISRTFVGVIYMIALFLPLVYLNFKLFKISREMRRRKATSPERRTTVNLKSISTCLLVVACIVVLAVPTSIYTIFNINTENKQASNVRLFFIWGLTFFTINCTFNSLIFFGRTKFYAQRE